MISTINKIWSIPTKQEKIQSIGLIVMMAISAGLEIVGIGLIVPIIGLIAQPEMVAQNRFVIQMQNVIGIDATSESFLYILCATIIVLFLAKNLFLIFQSFLQAKFVFRMGAHLGKRLYSKYMNAPYSFHLHHNSGHLIGSLELSNSIPNSVLMPFMIFTSETIVIILIGITLLVLSPFITIMLALSTITIIAIIYYPTRHYNYNLGKEFQEYALETQKYSLQGIKAIKESKVRNVEPFFISEFSRHVADRNYINGLRTFITNIPRFAIEAILVFLGMITLIIFIKSDLTSSSIILTLSLFAASMVRLMPSFSRLQYSLTSIKQNQALMERYFAAVSEIIQDDKNRVNGKILTFSDVIQLDKLDFKYSEEQQNVINNFNLTIPKNKSFAFVGATGCGKTTLIDLFLGLLTPQSGQILVDGVDIRENISSWQTRIGYVPQFIFLTDDTIKANVAFGVPEAEIDDSRVIECLKIAQIYDHIETLSASINTVIGENGVRLSGGQRQRIGIARALYHNPEILVLDEATSALDNETEKAFVDALKNLHGKLTILMVAHRLTTVENCDEVINLNNNSG